MKRMHNTRWSILASILTVACGGGQAAVASPKPAPAPPAAEKTAPPPTPPPPPAPPAPAASGCNGRKVSLTLTRAVGMGSYITTLSCSGNLFTVISDRATPDGKEVKSAFQVDAAEWEKAWGGIEKLGWRTYDDRCTPRENAQGRGDGPVYRITVEDPANKRTFICAGSRELAAPIDAVQTQLMTLAPAELADMPATSVGVKECDDYLDRYQRCVETKVPTDKRAGFIEAIRFTRGALRDTLLRDPDAELALAKQCKEMHAAARTTMAQFRCKL